MSSMYTKIDLEKIYKTWYNDDEEDDEDDDKFEIIEYILFEYNDWYIIEKND